MRGQNLIRRGTCSLCGEPDQNLYEFDCLPEEFEGVACARCGQFHEEEADRRAEIEFFREGHWQ